MRIISGNAFCRAVTGSYHVYGKPGERMCLSIPVHSNEPLKKGLQRHLMKLAGIEESAL